MNQELDQLFKEWEQEEIEYQNYLKSQLKESKKIHKFLKIEKEKDIEQEAFNMASLYLYLNLMVFCMRFIVDYVQENIHKYKHKQYKIEKPNYSIHELD
jgi:hypothetical protein